MDKLVESFYFHSNQHANKRQTGTYISTSVFMCLQMKSKIVAQKY